MFALSCGGRSPLPGALPAEPIPDAGARGGSGGIGLIDAGPMVDAGGNAGQPSEAGAAGAAGARMNAIDVRVRRLPNDIPVPDALLFMSDAAGAEVGTARTDSEGNARVEVPDGGAVSLLRSSTNGGSTSRSISSVYDLQENKPLLFLLGAPDDPLPTRDPMTVTLAAVSSPASAAAYYFSVPCWSTRLETYPKLVVEGFSGCAGKDTFDAYVLALDASGDVLAYGEALDRPFVAGQSIALDLTTNRTDFETQTIHAGPFPAATNSLVLFMMGYRPGDYALTSRAAMRYERTLESPRIGLDVVQRWPKGHFSDFKFGGRIELTNGAARLISGFDRFSQTLDPEFRFDPTKLALIIDASLDALVGMPPKLMFDLSSDGALGDALRFTTGWSSSHGTTTWTVTMLPRRSGAVVYPAVPTEFAYVSTSQITPPSASHFDDLARTDYWDYLASRVMDDASNLDSTALFQ